MHPFEFPRRSGELIGRGMRGVQMWLRICPSLCRGRFFNFPPLLASYVRPAHDLQERRELWRRYQHAWHQVGIAPVRGVLFRGFIAQKIVGFVHGCHSLSGTQSRRLRFQLLKVRVKLTRLDPECRFDLHRGAMRVHS